MLRLPDGIETIDNNWFRECEMEKVIVPSSVRNFGTHSFAYCEHLREVVFLFDYQQRKIFNFKYDHRDRGEGVTKGAHCILSDAFDGCDSLSVFSFRDGSRIERVGTPFTTRPTQERRWVLRGPGAEQDGTSSSTEEEESQ